MVKHILQKNCPKKKNKADAVLFSAFFVDQSDKEVYLDSGATAHYVKKKSLLKNLRKPTKNEVTVANKQTLNVECSGDIDQAVKVNGEKRSISITNVNYVPDICVNLLSVSQIVKNGNEVVFNKHGFKIYNNKHELIATGSLVNNMFKLDVDTANFACTAKNDDDTVLWHRRLGHIGATNMHFLSDRINKKINSKAVSKCITCVEGKQSRLPYKNSGTRATTILELVHSDICGPMTVNSLGNARYFATLPDY